MTARPKVRCPLTAKTPSARFNCLIFLSFSLCSSPLYSFSLVLHTSLPLLSLLPLIPLCSFSLSSFSRPPLLSVYSLSSFSPLCSFSLALHPFSLSFLSSLSSALPLLSATHLLSGPSRLCLFFLSSLPLPLVFLSFSLCLASHLSHRSLQETHCRPPLGR
eukprot:TRINITY_DN2015_c0_g1_i1.p5 TRINITY_DN2015_c0_g1~~TRINITY_DN2015_c0_g1_i1.p5  ORF type:complete len:161 (+),score=33.04 TRINITY_DN2015_c0_g1_i1:2999-3481(+)